MKLTKILTATAIGSAIAFTSVAYAADTMGQPKQSASEYAGDTVITTKVKAEIVKARDLSSMDIAVKTLNGAVTLSGTVGSGAQVDEAGQVARSVAGVTRVRNLLKIDASKAK